MVGGEHGYAWSMATNTRDIAATPDQVWEVLADGWLYPLWVVGATRMRDVDDSWPAEGSALHHSVGVWPVVLDDETRVLEVQPRRSIRLRAKAWPGGEAEVLIELEAHGDKTRVSIHEKAVSGPGSLMPQVIEAPLMKIRNTETLNRLAHVVEGRTAQTLTSSHEHP
jgi:uncharacterized protein YndB with AHSA1/START domain